MNRPSPTRPRSSASPSRQCPPPPPAATCLLVYILSAPRTPCSALPSPPSRHLHHPPSFPFFLDTLLIPFCFPECSSRFFLSAAAENLRPRTNPLRFLGETAAPLALLLQLVRAPSFHRPSLNFTGVNPPLPPSVRPPLLPAFLRSLVVQVPWISSLSRVT